MSSRARNKLNVKQVAGLTKPGIYSDGGGLYLRVRASGRSWFFIGTLHGKRQEMGLGSAFDVSLAKARERAAAAREMIVDGRDPRDSRPNKPELVEKPMTFGNYAIQYLDEIDDGFKNPKHRQQWRNTLKTYAEPIWQVPIADVQTNHVLDCLQPIWLSKPETASRVRGRIERVLDAARAKGLRQGDNPARARGHLLILLPKRDKVQVKHHPALPFDKVSAFMVELRRRSESAARALEFAILTAARSGEVRGMTWGEVDLTAKLWTVPKERMKAGKDHEVPLSENALAVLTALKNQKHLHSDPVFAAPRGGPFSDMALTQLLKRMGRSNITVHGFRSTFRDWAGDETQFEREVIEMALAHAVASKTEAAYRRGRALDKRRGLMSAWADYCDGIVSVSKAAVTAPDGAPLANDQNDNGVDDCPPRVV